MALAQSTQSLLRGRTVDAVSGRGVPARVECTRVESGHVLVAQAQPDGYYTIAFLSPGTYRLRIQAPGYRGQELEEIQIPVAAQIEIDFALRPRSDVWEEGTYLRSLFLPQGSVLPMFGPDVDMSRSASFEPVAGRELALEPSISEVIPGSLLRRVPLNGRDAYAFLMTQAGVTSESGTGRGLGFAVNGQRSTASNYLLDGTESNNFLTGGPLAPIPPEAIAEYRISTNNYSAEYGRSAGFLANVATRSGENQWHGVVYANSKHEVLNANSFQRNSKSLGRAPWRELQPGLATGGPLTPTIRASLAAEYYRFTTLSDPVTYRLPGLGLTERAPAGSLPRRLLEAYRPSQAPAAGLTGEVRQAIPSRVNRQFAMPRLDFTPVQGSHRVMVRANWHNLALPDYVWSPYPDFTIPLKHQVAATSASWISPLGPLLSEWRVGWTRDHLNALRPLPEIPFFRVTDGTRLPGASAPYGYEHRARQTDLAGTVRWSRGRHAVALGGGALWRQLDSALTAYRDGQVNYANAEAFATERPQLIFAAVSRLDGRTAPAYTARYAFPQSYGFVQDSLRWNRRLSVHLGLRYEYFGPPVTQDAQLWTELQLGTGTTFYDRVAAARFDFRRGGKHVIYGPDRNNFAPRVGLSWSPAASWLVKSAYGVFFDRLFDNLWQTAAHNNFEVRSATVSGTLPLNDNFRETFARLPQRPQQAQTKITLFQPNLRTPYVQSYFLSIEHRITTALQLRLQGAGSLGRKLLTTDLLNRFGTGPTSFEPNPVIANDFLYRANQGSSSYHALSSVLNYRTSHAHLQVAYSWSHSIDNQSDALASEFYDLGGLLPNRGGSNLSAGFLRQFDSRADRGKRRF